MIQCVCNLHVIRSMYTISFLSCWCNTMWHAHTAINECSCPFSGAMHMLGIKKCMPASFKINHVIAASENFL